MYEQMNLLSEYGHHVIEIDDAIYTQQMMRTALIDKFSRYAILPIRFQDGVPVTRPSKTAGGLHFPGDTNPWTHADYFLEAARTFSEVETQERSGTHLVAIAWTCITDDAVFMRYAGKVVASG